MKIINQIKKLTLSVAALGVIVSAQASAIPDTANVLEFGNDNLLFVANSNSGSILAYELPKMKANTKSQSYNLEGLGSKIADKLNIDEKSIRYNDIAVHPVTKNVYIALSTVSKDKLKSNVIKVNHAGDVSIVQLNKLPHTKKQLLNTADDKVKFWRDIPASSLTITDLDYSNGTLYVSGLSTGEFSSTLRKVDYPFTKNNNSSNIEIYHTVHNQTETRAPIRAMTILNLDGEQTVVAAYTCTPLVTIPVNKLKDGAHVKGKTIAELGYGNTPLDVIKFTAPNEQQKMEDYILVFNKERNADLISVADLTAANKKEGLSTPHMWAPAGVKTRPLPLANVLQADDQDEQFIVTLKRNLTTGDIDLLSYRKGAFFRLNDFISP